jgi:hypothetical protein
MLACGTGRVLDTEQMIAAMKRHARKEQMSVPTDFHSWLYRRTVVHRSPITGIYMADRDYRIIDIDGHEYTITKADFHSQCGDRASNDYEVSKPFIRLFIRDVASDKMIGLTELGAHVAKHYCLYTKYQEDEIQQYLRLRKKYKDIVEDV